MKLYQHPFSPNCQKVVALAHEVGVPLELATVEIFKGESRTPAMLAKNPNGKVPILEDGDFVLWESTAMLAYIAAKAGRADLAPTTPRERAEVDRWTSWQGAHFGPAIRKVAFERVVKKLVGPRGAGRGRREGGHRGVRGDGERPRAEPRHEGVPVRPAHHRRLRPRAVRRPRRELRPRLRALPEGQGVARAHGRSGQHEEDAGGRPRSRVNAFRGPRGAAPRDAAAPLLPHARVVPRQRRHGAGDLRPRLPRPAHAGRPRDGAGVAPPHRHQRVHRRAGEAPATRSGARARAAGGSGRCRRRRPPRTPSGSSRRRRRGSRGRPRRRAAPSRSTR